MTSDRSDFLLKMYETCWDNITRAEDSLWKIFAAYTALFAGLGLAKDVIDASGFLFIMTIFSFAGIVSCLISNSWFARNMGIISNIEKEFLIFTKDNKNIIPASWVREKVPFFNKENWWVIVMIFFAIIIAIHIVLYNKITQEQLTKQIALDVVGVVFISIYWAYLSREHKKFEENAKGIDPTIT